MSLTMTSSYTVVLPTSFEAPRPSAQVYARRRLMVGMVAAAMVMVLWVGASSVLANRGGAPASTPAVRPAASSGSAAVYLVQPGDTLWSIADRHRGSQGQADYVDTLVERNGGTTLHVGQQLVLP